MAASNAGYMVPPPVTVRDDNSGAVEPPATAEPVDASSSVMVPAALPSNSVALTGLLSKTVNISAFSSAVSSRMATLTVAAVAPTSSVSVPRGLAV